MMGVLFLREHNRIATSLKRAYPSWDDERLFQTARNILIVILIKIVVEEYINHISPYYFKLLADPTGFRNPRWYRQNWMAIEFNLLYRWHPLVPSSFRLGGRDLAIEATLFNTDAVVENGLGALLRGRLQAARGPGRPVQLGTRAVGRRRWPACSRRARSSCAPTTTTASSRASRARLASTRSPATSGSRRRCATCTGASTRSSSIRACSPRTSRPNAVLPALIGRLVAIDAFSQALHEPAAGPARVQREDVLAARVGSDPDDQHAVGPGAPQHPGYGSPLSRDDDAPGLGATVGRVLRAGRSRVDPSRRRQAEQHDDGENEKCRRSADRPGRRR